MRLLLPAIIAFLPLPAAEPTIPPAIALQWSSFQRALTSNDMSTLLSMTQFPLKSNEFGGDIKSPSAFKAKFSTLFPLKTIQCLVSSPLHQRVWKGRTHYEAWCDVSDYPVRFIFDAKGGKLFLTTIDNGTCQRL